MPICTPRLLIRPKEAADGEQTVAAVRETWDDLHRWMAWAEDLGDNTVEQQDLRARLVSVRFDLREELNLVGVERATGTLVVWCGLHDIDWPRRGCETGFWVRRSAQGNGYATEATNALLRYAFGPLRMHSVGITHSAGNEASRRVVEKLGFTPTGIVPNGNPLPGGRTSDKHCYVRRDLVSLPDLPVTWG